MIKQNIVLDLPLKKEWYEMIESGIKKEEYREIKSYWIKRLCYTKGNCDWGGYCKLSNCSIRKGRQSDYTHIRFRYGYTKRTMLFELKGITIGKGKTEWGAPEDKEVFILKLGDKIV